MFNKINNRVLGDALAFGIVGILLGIARAAGWFYVIPWWSMEFDLVVTVAIIAFFGFALELLQLHGFVEEQEKNHEIKELLEEIEELEALTNKN